MPRRRRARTRTTVSLPAELPPKATQLAQAYRIEFNDLVGILIHNDVENPTPLTRYSPARSRYAQLRLPLTYPADLRRAVKARIKALELTSLSAYIAALIARALAQPPGPLVIFRRS
jgi:hypothetical protein